MKVNLIWDATAKCDLCEKHKDCIQLYRNAKRGEPQNFLVLVCRDCAWKILQAFPLQLTNTGKPL